ncbi:hypothetical protein PSEUDO8O_90024 [Pseudomonas sp. 8O]|nr:hypothetical protein PSEUDO8O_90024 [Pseudomonas sp. 8O]
MISPASGKSMQARSLTSLDSRSHRSHNRYRLSVGAGEHEFVALPNLWLACPVASGQLLPDPVGCDSVTSPRTGVSQLALSGSGMARVDFDWIERT